MDVLYALLRHVLPAKSCSVSLYPYVVFAESIRPGLATNVAAGTAAARADAAAYNGCAVMDIAQMVLRTPGIETAIGMAALNSALDITPIENRLRNVNAFEILLQRGKNKNISIIGHFPFVEHLQQKKIARNLWVFELRPKSDDDLSPEDFSEYLPKSDVILMSGTTLIHHTFDTIRKYFNNSYTMLVGPSTPLSSVLFDFGIDMISGTLVADTEKARESFSRGAKFREAQGLRFVSLLKE